MLQPTERLLRRIFAHTCRFLESSLRSKRPPVLYHYLRKQTQYGPTVSGFHFHRRYINRHQQHSNSHSFFLRHKETQAASALIVCYKLSRNKNIHANPSETAPRSIPRARTIPGRLKITRTKMAPTASLCIWQFLSQKFLLSRCRGWPARPAPREESRGRAKPARLRVPTPFWLFCTSRKIRRKKKKKPSIQSFGLKLNTKVPKGQL